MVSKSRSNNACGSNTSVVSTVSAKSKSSRHSSKRNRHGSGSSLSAGNTESMKSIIKHANGGSEPSDVGHSSIQCILKEAIREHQKHVQEEQRRQYDARCYRDMMYQQQQQQTSHENVIQQQPLQQQQQRQSGSNYFHENKQLQQQQRQYAGNYYIENDQCGIKNSVVSDSYSVGRRSSLKSDSSKKSGGNNERNSLFAGSNVPYKTLVDNTLNAAPDPPQAPTSMNHASDKQDASNASIVDPPKKPLNPFSKIGSSFGSLKRNKAQKSMNRISASGVIETIVCKDEDGKEKSYKGKLRRCPRSTERMLLELQSVSDDDEENGVVDKSATDEGREDIETGIVLYQGCFQTEKREESGGREGFDPSCSSDHTSSNDTKRTANDENSVTKAKVPVLADPPPLLEDLGNPACSAPSIFERLFGKSEVDNNPFRMNCNPNDANPDPSENIKQVRFSFDEGDNNSVGSTRSTRSAGNQKPNGILKMRQWPGGSLFSTGELEDSKKKNSKLTKQVLIGMAIFFAIIIIALLSVLIFFFARNYEKDHE